jgi:hypothetical protein
VIAHCIHSQHGGCPRCYAAAITALQIMRAASDEGLSWFAPGAAQMMMQVADAGLNGDMPTPEILRQLQSEPLVHPGK